MKTITWLILCLFVFMGGQAYATDYYIDNTGTDGSNCGTMSKPCASLVYVLSNHVSNGDTIFVMPGTYTAATQMISGRYIDVYQRDMTITAQDKNNIFHDNVFGRVGLNDNDGIINNWFVWNNVFYDLCSQPRYGCSAVNVGLVDNAHVVHNTIYSVREVKYTGTRVSGINAGANGDRVQNNAIYNTGDDTINDNGGVTDSGGSPDSNYIYSSNRGDAGCAGNCFPSGPNDLASADPGFLDASNKDFRLAGGSVLRKKESLIKAVAITHQTLISMGIKEMHFLISALSGIRVPQTTETTIILIQAVMMAVETMAGAVATDILPLQLGNVADTPLDKAPIDGPWLVVCEA